MGGLGKMGNLGNLGGLRGLRGLGRRGRPRTMAGGTERIYVRYWERLGSGIRYIPTLSHSDLTLRAKESSE